MAKKTWYSDWYKPEAVEELLTWQQETGQPLPYSPEEIADMEAQGIVVDLETGELLTLEEVDIYTLGEQGGHRG